MRTFPGIDCESCIAPMCELPRQTKETQAQILARRAMLISLDAQTSEDEWRAVCVIPYMADF
jgi:hypothetical protein